MKRKSDHIFLLENTPEKVLAAHALAEESIRKIAESEYLVAKTGIPPYCVWISREEDLHDFVYQIPDLAWDMLEYAEEPLEILYPQIKFISPLQESAETHISIRMVRGKKLADFVRRHGPLLAFPMIEQHDQVNWIDETHDLREKEKAYDRVKTMKLNRDNSFTFVR